MSLASDLKFAKWIIRRGDAPQDVVQKCLAKIKKAEADGQSCPNLLTLLFKQGVLDRSQAEEVKLAWKEHRESAKQSSASAVITEAEVTASEFVHSEAEANAEDRAEKSAPVVQEAQADERDGAKSTDLPIQKITCIECQSLNSAKEKDCQTCGAVLPVQNLVTCLACHHTQKKNRKNCYHCGCDLKTGKAGKNSSSCRNCQTVLMPDQVICLQCGSLYVEQKSKRWAWAGHGLAALQAVLVLGSAGYLSMGSASLDHLVQDSIKQVVLLDPYSDVPPRSVGEKFVGAELQPEDRAWLEEASQQKDSWRILESKVIEKEDRYGLHGALMLGLSFFEENRGLELVALAKAHDSNASLKALAVAWRMKQARKAFDRYEAKQALVQAQDLVKGDDASGFTYFWAGVFAFADQDLERAKVWFEKSVAAKRPVAQSHLFLYLLNKKDKSVAEKHLELLYGGVRDAGAIKVVVEPYLEKS